MSNTPTDPNAASAQSGLDLLQQAGFDPNSFALGDTTTSTPTPLGGVPYYAHDAEGNPTTDRWTAKVQQPANPITSGAMGAVGVGWGTGPQTVAQLPRYYRGDAQAYLADMQPELIDDLQQTMVALKLYSSAKPNITYKIADPETVSALEKVMGAANASGRTVDDQLKVWVQQGLTDKSPTVTAPSAVALPSPSDLLDTFRAASKSQLGRTLPDSVLQSMVGAYNAQVIAASAAQDQAQASAATMDVAGNLAAPTFQQAPSASGFAEDQLRQNYGEEQQQFKTLQTVNAFRQMLSGPGRLKEYG